MAQPLSPHHLLPKYYKIAVDRTSTTTTECQVNNVYHRINYAVTTNVDSLNIDSSQWLIFIQPNQITLQGLMGACHHNGASIILYSDLNNKPFVHLRFPYNIRGKDMLERMALSYCWVSLMPAPATTLETLYDCEVYSTYHPTPSLSVSPPPAYGQELSYPENNNEDSETDEETICDGNQ